MKPPLLDKRTRDALLDEALRLARPNPLIGWEGYVRDWSATESDPDPAYRLVETFARLGELLIERINEVPERNFLAFLDFAGIERFPGAPATVPVTFAISKRASVGGIVKAGTQVGTTQTKTSDALVFETLRDFFASRARVESLVAVHPAGNRVVHAPVPPVPVTPEWLQAVVPVTVLTGSVPPLPNVDHVLYIASEPLFARKDAADITVVIDVSSGVFPSSVEWRRFDKALKQWVQLTSAYSTSAPSFVRITLPALSDVAKTTVDGVEDFWIAAHWPQTVPAMTSLPVIRSIEGSVGGDEITGIRLDAAFYNATRMDVTRPFLPFGPRPSYGDAFYFASDVAFSPDNAQVTLNWLIAPYVDAVLKSQFAGLPTGGMSVRTRARWQYLDATKDWIDLASFDHEFQFSANNDPALVVVTRTSYSSTGIPTSSGVAGEGLFIGSSSGDTLAQVTFTTFPDDIGRHAVNGVESRWLRVLLTTEHPYGRDGVLVSGATPRYVGPLFIPPRVDSVVVSARPRTAPVSVSRVKTLNNFEFSDVAAGALTIAPFAGLSSRQLSGNAVFGNDAALYIGFDRQLEPDAFMSILIDLARSGSADNAQIESGDPVIAWEYWSAAGGWLPLDVADDTLNLTTSGTIAFAAPRDAASAKFFTQLSTTATPDLISRWWLRARLASGTYDHSPLVRGAYINTVYAENRSTHAEMLIGSSNGEPDQTFALVKGPVLAGDVWVRETERPTAAEVRQLDIEHAEERGQPAPPESRASPNVREAEDGNGAWVRWRRVANFRISGQRSRHYLLDSVAAIVRFGNGAFGQIPVIGRNNIVFRDLQVGGGSSANRDAGALTVKELKSSLPFIDKIFNVQPAAAGASPWTIEQFGEFGPQALKNRGRAVTTEDYEWMIRQRFSDVARVRCRAVSEPGPGGSLQFKAGGVTAIIVPWSVEPRPQPSQGLIREVREFLATIVLSNVVADVHVKGPDYIAVSVEAELVPKRPELAMTAVRKATTAIEEFLHPLTGGEERKGYGFGRPVFLSEIHAVLERIDEVDHVVFARFAGYPGVDTLNVTLSRLPSSGVHEITIASA